MTLKRTLLASTIFMAMLAISASANAGTVSSTIATFANPSDGSEIPLFAVNFSNGAAGSITGSWQNDGLTLEIPAGNTSYDNVHFTMDDLTYNYPMGGNNSATGGSIEFTAGSNTPGANENDVLLVVSFESLYLGMFETGLHAQTLYGHGVTFSGNDLNPLGDLTNEQFGFAFTNINKEFDVNGAVTSYTATASFDSSAVVPEPATVLLLSSGFLAFVHRRKKTLAPAS